MSAQERPPWLRGPCWGCGVSPGGRTSDVGLGCSLWAVRSPVPQAWATSAAPHVPVREGLKAKCGVGTRGQK